MFRLKHTTKVTFESWRNVWIIMVDVFGGSGYRSTAIITFQVILSVVLNRQKKLRIAALELLPPLLVENHATSQRGSQTRVPQNPRQDA